MAQDIDPTENTDLTDTSIANLPFGPVTDTKGASKYTGLAENTLIVMRSRGDGPRYIKYRRAVRYRVEDLKEYVESRIRSNTVEVA